MGGARSLVYNIVSFTINVIYLFHMPLFMFISGYCFNFNRSPNLLSLIKNKAQRLLAPFIFTSLCVAIPAKYLGGFWSDSSCVITDIILGQFVFFPSVHLWFVISLFEIFVIYYIIEKIRIKKGIVFWLVLLLLSITGTMLNKIPDFLCVLSTIRYLFYFALGYNLKGLIDKYEVIIQSKHVFITCLLFIITYLIPMGKAFMIKQVLMALLGIGLVITCSIVLVRYSAVKNSIIYNYFSKNSYGLYLYTDPFNYILLFIIYPLWGDSIYADNTYSLLMFLIRAIGTTMAAVLIIFLADNFKLLHFKYCGAQKKYQR